MLGVVGIALLALLFMGRGEKFFAPTPIKRTNGIQTGCDPTPINSQAGFLIKPALRVD